MPIPLTINGVTYNYPLPGEVGWGLDATSWAEAVTGGVLTKIGGNFFLLNDVNFGPNYGLVGKSFRSQSDNSIGNGVLQLAKGEGISWGNPGFGSEINLSVNSNDDLIFNGNINLGANYIKGIVPVGKLPIATSSAFGIVRPDNTTITVANGVLTAIGGASAGVSSFKGRTGVVVPVLGDYSFSLISGTAAASQLPLATSSTFGAIRPDNNTITITNGVITSNAGTGTTSLRLTTTGTSGLSTLTGNPNLGYTLNIPNYVSVNSFNGRTGAIVPLLNDYSFSLIGGTATPSQLPLASSSAYGIVKPDNTTITIANGVLTSIGGGVQSFNGRTGIILPVYGDYTTTMVAEGTNLYFTSARAIAALLSGYNKGTTFSNVLPSDTILQALQKIDGNSQLQPDWNANTGIQAILNKPNIPSPYSLPTSSTTTLGGVKIDGTTITINANGVISSTGGGGGGAVQSVTGNIVSGTTANPVVTQVQPDWNATSGLGTILNKPTIPAGQVNSDWNATSGVAQILNKPSIPSPYTLPVSTATQLGGVKIGSGVTVAADGTISVSGGGGAVQSVTGNIVSGTTANPVVTQVQPDWNASTGLGTILNKPTIQAPITLTTTGTSGAATFNNNTLNIPQYSGGGDSVKQLVSSLQLNDSEGIGKAIGGPAYYHTIDSANTTIISALNALYQLESDGTLTTLLSQTQLGGLATIAYHTIDSAGTIIMSAQGGGVWQRTSSGVITQLLSKGDIGNGSAQFHTIDSSGTLVVSTFDTGVYQRTSAGVITQLLTSAQIGSGGTYYHTIDASGTLVVSVGPWFGSAGAIYQRTSAGVVTQLVSIAQLNNNGGSRHHSIDASGTITISASGAGVWQRTSAGVLTQLVTPSQIGSGIVFYHSKGADGTLTMSAYNAGVYQRTSAGTVTQLIPQSRMGRGSPRFHTLDSSGTLVVSDEYGGLWKGLIVGNTITNLTQVLTTTTFTATGDTSYGDPFCHTIDSDGSILVSANNTGLWRRKSNGLVEQIAGARNLGGGFVQYHTIDASGTITISAGYGGVWQGTAGGVFTNIISPSAMGTVSGGPFARFHTVSSSGTVIVSSNSGIYQRTSAGVISALADVSQTGSSGAFYHIIDDATGLLTYSTLQTISQRTSAGVFTTLINRAQGGVGGLSTLSTRLVFDSNNNLYVSSYNPISYISTGGIWKRTPAGVITQLASSSQLGNGDAYYFSLQSNGDIYVSALNSGVWKITSAGVISQVITPIQIGTADAYYHTLDANGLLTVSSQDDRQDQSILGGVFQTTITL